MVPGKITRNIAASLIPTHAVSACSIICSVQASLLHLCHRMCASTCTVVLWGPLSMCIRIKSKGINGRESQCFSVLHGKDTTLTSVSDQQTNNQCKSQSNTPGLGTGATAKSTKLHALCCPEKSVPEGIVVQLWPENTQQSC